MNIVIDVCYFAVTVLLIELFPSKTSDSLPVQGRMSFSMIMDIERPFSPDEAVCLPR
jgi:hypothetical protein